MVHPIAQRVLALSPPPPKPRRPEPSLDRVVEVSVNVPFPRRIDVATLAAALRDNQVPAGFSGHLSRFIEELSLELILCFCDDHGIDAATLARFYRSHRASLPLDRPELEEHLDALVPRP